jgi:16S rRNA C967 or C1407 C5-methylase (RsmB/RsmF family)/NOL1/NOP2/fmu family ribosome biogenesis protein
MTSDLLPPEFVKSMSEQLGESYLKFSESLTSLSPVSIRYNPNKNSFANDLEKIPWAKNGRYLKERPVFTLDPLLHAGAYYVQEASSMFLEQAFTQAVDQTSSINVLDLCAAPGGKSTHMLSLMNQKSLLVSNEVIRSRAYILSENIQKWGYENVVVTNNDPEDFQRLPGFFDVVIVDAPCSGEGLFRKDQEAMKEWSTSNVELCSKRQRRIISDVWPALKQNGILIYSTCTFNEKENEENLEWLKKEQDVEFIKLDLASEWGIENIHSRGVDGYRFFPHQVKGEGFFLSVIRKTKEEAASKIKGRPTFVSPSSKIVSELKDWIIFPEEKTFINRQDRFQFFPKDKVQEIEFLAKNLYLLSAGTLMATVKHDKLIPEHAMATSIKLNKEKFPALELELADALRYLRKETLHVDSARKGFSLISYENTPLGWANVLDNRINNLYPSEWRVRMSNR